jgi:hypothetical protein
MRSKIGDLKGLKTNQVNRDACVDRDIVRSHFHGDLSGLLVNHERIARIFPRSKPGTPQL